MSITIGPQGYPIPPTPVVSSPAVALVTSATRPQPALQVTPTPQQDSSPGGRGQSDTQSENQSNPNGAQRGRLLNISA